MTTKVFYSFHYARDWWRVNTIRQIGALDQQPILAAQDWEQMKRRGSTAVEDWIKDQMKGCDAVVVLTGAETALREWVQWEIRYAWQQQIPLCGVRIHCLKDQYQQTDHPGRNPFEQIPMTDGSTMDTYVPLHEPSGLSSQTVYREIAANLPKWVANAYQP